MPDPALTYGQVAARARLAADTLARRTVATLYDEMAALLARLVEMGTGEGLSAERARALAASIEGMLGDLTLELAATSGDGAAAAVRLAPAAHAAAVSAVGAPAVSFGDVPVRAVRALMARRQIAQAYGVDSYSGFFRAVMDRAAKGLGPEVDTLLTSQVARGLSVDRATTELAALLAKNDPALLAAVQRLGAQGGLRRKLEQTAAEMPSEASMAEGRQLMQRARRVAQTEIVTAHREGDRLSAQQSPVVGALRWRVSGNHPHPDVCDVYATQDLHGLGAGLYHPATTPGTPHPHCHCYYGYVTRPPAEWNTPKAAPTEPRDVDRAAIERLMVGQPEGYVNRQVRAARTGLATAYEVRG